MQRGLGRQTQLTLRIPYDVKAERVRYTTLANAPFTPPYGDIHHRSETLRGISDASAMLEWSHGSFVFGVGSTLPIGRTAANPVVLGRLGIRHEHLQFGSGTFEPKLAAQFATHGWFGRVEQTLSVYDDREGFRAPQTSVASFGPTVRFGRFSFDPRLNAQYQTRARWNGEVDEGSGFHSGGIRLQVSTRAGSWVIAPGVYHELWSHGFAGQTFRQSTTWSLGASRLF